MPEARAAALNPHALPPAADVSSRRLEGCVMLGEAGDACWPLRLGRVWPGVAALRGPRHPRYDLAGGPHGADAEALRRMLDQRQWPSDRPHLLAIGALTAEGPAWDALAALAAEGRIGLHVLARWERALLERSAAPDANAYFERFHSAEQRKALRRKRRRLAEAGTLAFRVLDQPAGIEEALATFCHLESEGWKGRAGTALAQDPAGRAYVAEVLGATAAAGDAFAAILSAGEAPLAAGLFLRAGGEVLFWKTAYDEGQAKHSPGVVFDVLLTEWLYDQPWFERLDAGHDDSVDPATLIWRQRRPMADVLIDLAPGSFAGRLALAGMTMRRRLRALRARHAGK